MKTSQIEKLPAGTYSSENLFQRYSHDKFFDTRQSDIEPDAKPRTDISKTAQMQKLGKKLTEILL
tara:strand:- start:280 stop:474 length:195 start_codon:yes stop_codon:yes gene_type:complete